MNEMEFKNEVNNFCAVVSNKGLGYLFGMEPRENENKDDFKMRVIEYVEIYNPEHVSTIKAAKPGEVWGQNPTIRRMTNG